MLKERIERVSDVKIGVLGLGYVGLPLAIKMAKTGFSVVGVDTKADVVERLQSGFSTVEGIDNTNLTEVLTTKKTLSLVAVDNVFTENSPSTIAALKNIDVFVICVPTPLKSREGWEPDLGDIRRARDLIKAISDLEAKDGCLPTERLVVLESSTYPGTTKQEFKELIESHQPSTRWYLAYSPERMSPGPDAFNEEKDRGPRDEPPAFQITRVVGGYDDESLEIAAALFRHIHAKVHTVSSLECAEMTKLVENTFRFVSIGFSNELSRIAKAFGLNAWEVIGAAQTKMFGFDLCSPGLIGGHCIPIDPHYLSWALRNKREIATFVDVAERAHQDIKREALELIQRALNHKGRGFADSRILFLGIAYKKNVADIRESAPLELMKKLLAANANVTFWDPVRGRHPIRSRPKVFFTEKERLFLSEEFSDQLQKDGFGKSYFEPDELTGDWSKLRTPVLNDYHCIVLATAHKEFDETYYELALNDSHPLFVDLTNGVFSWIEKAFSSDEAAKHRAALLKDPRYLLVGYK